MREPDDETEWLSSQNAILDSISPLRDDQSTARYDDPDECGSGGGAFDFEQLSIDDVRQNRVLRYTIIIDAAS